jgi:hypothetical protein
MYLNSKSRSEVELGLLNLGVIEILLNVAMSLYYLDRILSISSLSL